MMTSLAFPLRRVLRVDLYPRTNFPDFITSARRELMLSEVLVFLVGAASCQCFAVEFGGGRGVPIFEISMLVVGSCFVPPGHISFAEFLCQVFTRDRTANRVAA
jgi:hypothetical protein